MKNGNKSDGHVLVEPARELPVLNGFDVVVCGGGVAGVAAAIAVARSGARTCLIEKMISLGGLATLGNIVQFLPICDGRGHQIIAGLTQELLELSVNRDSEGIPKAWRDPLDSKMRARQRFRTEFNPAEFALDLEKLCVDAGIELMYDTRLCSATVSLGSINAAIVENKSGRFAVSGRCFIDATGDADLCHVAHAPTVSIQSNVRAGWYTYIEGNRAVHRALSSPFNRDASILKDEPHYAGDSGRETSRQVVETRELMREDWDAVRQRKPETTLIRLSEVPGFRMTRRIQGDATILFSDTGKETDGGVGWFPSWRESELIWNLPLASLYSTSVGNLLAVGRCVSADGAAWDIARAIPVCVLTGEVAGIAAAQLVLDGRSTIADVDVAKLRDELEKRGNIVTRGEDWE